MHGGQISPKLSPFLLCTVLYYLGWTHTTVKIASGTDGQMLDANRHETWLPELSNIYANDFFSLV